MSKKYATIGNEVRYREEEISYEDSWKKGNFFEDFLKRRKEKMKSESVSEFLLNIFFDLLELALG